MNAIATLTSRWAVSGRLIASGLPGGLEAAVLPQLVQAAGTRGYIHVCVDDQGAAQLAEQIAGFHHRLISCHSASQRWPNWHARCNNQHSS
jgi:hypothetical protein